MGTIHLEFSDREENLEIKREKSMGLAFGRADALLSVWRVWEPFARFLGLSKERGMFALRLRVGLATPDQCPTSSIERWEGHSWERKGRVPEIASRTQP